MVLVDFGHDQRDVGAHAEGEQLEMTAHPAAANFGSSSRAMSRPGGEDDPRQFAVAPSGMFGASPSGGDVRRQWRVQPPLAGLA